MTRKDKYQEKFRELFGSYPELTGSSDPELMEILQKMIFGDVFSIGELDDQLRELITVVLLSVQQALPQLRSHVGAALRIGNSPLAIREAIYQCAPFIGFPRVLNAVNTMNEVFAEQEIALPLAASATVDEASRHERGVAIQGELYGSGMRERFAKMPEELREPLVDLLTDACFGDFYTRDGLDTRQRELLVFCGLIAIGADFQIASHARGNMKAGNSREVLMAAIIHCIPYIGFPYGLNALAIVQDL
ncbi:carboxymuconolactone decarboxylase family protein [Culicoidibacter larvae]|nr:carboxymuconolactone decarboxylase family protein [Culicoidibacter larvae]